MCVCVCVFVCVRACVCVCTYKTGTSAGLVHNATNDITIRVMQNKMLSNLDVY